MAYSLPAKARQYARHVARWAGGLWAKAPAALSKRLAKPPGRVAKAQFSAYWHIRPAAGLGPIVLALAAAQLAAALALACNLRHTLREGWFSVLVCMLQGFNHRYSPVACASYAPHTAPLGGRYGYTHFGPAQAKNCPHKGRTGGQGGKYRRMVVHRVFILVFVAPTHRKVCITARAAGGV